MQAQEIQEMSPETEPKAHEPRTLQAVESHKTVKPMGSYVNGMWDAIKADGLEVTSDPESTKIKRLRNGSYRISTNFVVRPPELSL